MEKCLDMFQGAYQLISPDLDERTRRRLLGAFAHVLGHGGISAVAEIAGVDRQTVSNGKSELTSRILGTDAEEAHRENPTATPEPDQPSKRIRRPGAGRKTILVETEGKVSEVLASLLEPHTRGDPESPLKWTSKSCRNLAGELVENGFRVSHSTVTKLLHDMGYSLQANVKTLEGSSKHPDRNAQFEYINDKAKLFEKYNQPIISVDSKKKELIGNFKNQGKEYSKSGEPTLVNCHDFLDPQFGRVNPFGIYDPTKNEGWVNLGIDHDTAEFAVESIRRWWQKMGIIHYPNASKLFITCDGGGSNGYRVRLWKTSLQNLSNETGLTIHVSHFPPGTSKWNKIEHRLFSHISMNWRGKPLLNYEVIVNLIANTKTNTGLTVRCELDTNSYEKSIKIPDKEFANLSIEKDDFHGEWNYYISPKK